MTCRLGTFTCTCQMALLCVQLGLQPCGRHLQDLLARHRRRHQHLCTHSGGSSDASCQIVQGIKLQEYYLGTASARLAHNVSMKQILAGNLRLPTGRLASDIVESMGGRCAHFPHVPPVPRAKCMEATINRASLPGIQQHLRKQRKDMHAEDLLLPPGSILHGRSWVQVPDDKFRRSNFESAWLDSKPYI